MRWTPTQFHGESHFGRWLVVALLILAGAAAALVR